MSHGSLSMSLVINESRLRQPQSRRTRVLFELHHRERRFALSVILNYLTILVVKRVEIGPGEFVVIPVTYQKHVEEAWTILTFSSVPIELNQYD